MRGVGGIAALGGGAVCAVGLAIDPDAVLRGWLAGFVFWIGFPVGALMLLLAHDLTGGRWGDAVREPLRAFVGTLPVMALMVVPDPGLPAGSLSLGAGGRGFASRQWFLSEPLFFRCADGGLFRRLDAVSRYWRNAGRGWRRRD